MVVYQPQRTQSTIEDRLKYKSVIAGMTSHYGRVIRVIGRRHIDVNIERSYSNAVAWTTMKSDVCLNESVMESKIMSYIMNGDSEGLTQLVATINSAMHHELCHLLYSPCMNSGLLREVKYQSIWRSFNILEDMRIESIYVNRFSSYKRYFSLMVARWVLGDPDAAHPDNRLGNDSDSAYLSLLGRKYLPSKMLSAFRKSFIKAHGLALCLEAEKIDDEFKSFAMKSLDSDQAVKVVALVSRYNEIILACGSSTDQAESTGHQDEPASCGKPRDNKEERDYEAKEVKSYNEAKDNGEEGNDDEEDEDDTESPEPTDSGSTEDGTPDDGDSEVEGDDDGAEVGVSGDGDSDDDDSGDSDSDGGDDGSSIGSGSGKSSQDKESEVEPPTDPDVGTGAGSASKVIDDYMNDDRIKDDLSEIINSVSTSGDSGRARDRLSPYGETTPLWGEARTNAVSVSQQIGKCVERLRNELEPENVSGSRVGKLNVRKAIRREVKDLPDVRIFNKFEPSREDEASIDIALAVDMSGSMRGQDASQACAAAWAIKRSMDRMGLPCLVTSFDQEGYVVWDYDEPASQAPGEFFTGGGTSPVDAFIACDAFFNRPRPSRSQCFIALTDGEWGASVAHSEAVVQMMRSRNVYTGLFGLDKAVAYFGDHGFESAVDVNSALDMLPFVDAAIKRLTKDVVHLG